MMDMATYESRLDANLQFALDEGSMHFEEANAVHKTLRRIADRLDDLGVAYAVVGAMALFAHGYRRFTDDVDLLVTAESMARIREELDGLGYTRPAGTTTKLRDADSQVRIEFLISGHYPGDGKPKPVAFPDPAAASIEINGIRYLNLDHVIELKLASGLSAPHRLKDLGDVQEMIKVLSLPREAAERLNPYVRDKFLELWDAVAAAPPE
jgi:hypothetical protein